MAFTPLFTGCAPALVTPFYADGRVDYDTFTALCERQIQGGASALVVLGTTGEPATLADDERDALIAACINKAAGRVPVIVGTGSNSTAHACQYARRAHELGAQSQLVVTPYYNKTTQSGLIAHFSAIAKAAPLPIIAYNVPSRTGMSLMPATMEKLLDIEGIVAIKDASGDVGQTAQLAKIVDGRAALYSGNDDSVLSTLALGGVGAISVAMNAFPERVSALYTAFEDGDMKKARDEQLSMLPLISALFAQVSPIPVKALMSLMGLCENVVRLPLVPMEGDALIPLQSLLS